MNMKNAKNTPKSKRNNEELDDHSRFVNELRKVLYFCVFAAVVIAVLYVVLD